MNDKIAIITKRINYYDFYILIVPDISAGRRNRFTIYKVPTSEGHRVKIVGRELPLGFAKKYAKKCAKQYEEKAIKEDKRINNLIKKQEKENDM